MRKNNGINPINFVSVNLIYEIGTEIELQMLSHPFQCELMGASGNFWTQTFGHLHRFRIRTYIREHLSKSLNREQLFSYILPVSC